MLHELILGGTIYTMKGKTPQLVEAVAVQGDKIVHAGSKAEAIKSLPGEAQMIDLKGKRCSPGLSIRIPILRQQLSIR